jgi:hypothetical protein
MTFHLRAPTAPNWQLHSQRVVAVLAHALIAHHRLHPQLQQQQQAHRGGQVRQAVRPARRQVAGRVRSLGGYPLQLASELEVEFVHLPKAFTEKFGVAGSLTS